LQEHAKKPSSSNQEEASIPQFLQETNAPTSGDGFHAGGGNLKRPTGHARKVFLGDAVAPRRPKNPLSNELQPEIRVRYEAVSIRGIP
jgi:hypothetical protein